LGDRRAVDHDVGDTAGFRTPSIRSSRWCFQLKNTTAVLPLFDEIGHELVALVGDRARTSSSAITGIAGAGCDLQQFGCHAGGVGRGDGALA
jgi:hypothetical protein